MPKLPSAFLLSALKHSYTVGGGAKAQDVAKH